MKYFFLFLFCFSSLSWAMGEVKIEHFAKPPKGYDIHMSDVSRDGNVLTALLLRSNGYNGEFVGVWTQNINEKKWYPLTAEVKVDRDGAAGLGISISSSDNGYDKAWSFYYTDYDTGRDYYLLQVAQGTSKAETVESSTVAAFFLKLFVSRKGGNLFYTVNDEQLVHYDFKTKAYTSLTRGTSFKDIDYNKDGTKLYVTTSNKVYYQKPTEVRVTEFTKLEQGNWQRKSLIDIYPDANQPQSPVNYGYLEATLNLERAVFVFGRGSMMELWKIENGKAEKFLEQGIFEGNVQFGESAKFTNGGNTFIYGVPKSSDKKSYYIYDFNTSSNTLLAGGPRSGGLVGVFAGKYLGFAGFGEREAVSFKGDSLPLCRNIRGLDNNVYYGDAAYLHFEYDFTNPYVVCFEGDDEDNILHNKAYLMNPITGTKNLIYTSPERTYIDYGRTKDSSAFILRQSSYGEGDEYIRVSVPKEF